jgi:hypothetical protein
MNIRLTILMMILLFVYLTSKGQDTISVVDKRNSNTSENVGVVHKDRDVIISRENTHNVKSKTYWVNMYRMDNGT